MVGAGLKLSGATMLLHATKEEAWLRTMQKMVLQSLCLCLCMSVLCMSASKGACLGNKRRTRRSLWLR